MSEDGKRVFFTTQGQAAEPGTDTDESADVYETEVDGRRPQHPADLHQGRHGEQRRQLHAPGRPRPVERASPAKASATRSPSPAAPASLRATGDSTSSAPSSSTAPKGKRTRPISTWSDPGGRPDFVATIDSSAGKPGPQPLETPARQRRTSSRGLSTAEAAAVDQGRRDDTCTSSSAVAGPDGPLTARTEPRKTSPGPERDATKSRPASRSASAKRRWRSTMRRAARSTGALYVRNAPARVADLRRSTAKNSANSPAPSEACGVAIDRSPGSSTSATTLPGGLALRTELAARRRSSKANYT